MRIDDFTERRIKEAANIVDVAADLCQGMRKSGAEYTALCPFHGDRRTGNFMISPRKNIARCFACDTTVDPAGLVMKVENLDYPDALRWLARKYGIDVPDAERFNTVKPSKPRPPQPPPKPREVRYWPIGWLDGWERNTKNDALVRWMRSLPWDAVQRSRIDEVLQAYRIGHSCLQFGVGEHPTEWHDFTLFPQIDLDGRLCNIHMMKYHDNGHRVKEKEHWYATSWLHAQMKRYKREREAGIRRFDPATDEPARCLFGLHLATIHPSATVNIVESEKTALLMSIAYGGSPRQIWMACQGIGNLTNTLRLLQPLTDRKRQIVLYPDRDGIQAWMKAAQEIDYPQLQVNTTPVKKWWCEADGPKADIADIVVRYLTTPPARATDPPRRQRRVTQDRACRTEQTGKILSDMAAKNPVLRDLIKRLDLEAVAS